MGRLLLAGVFLILASLPASAAPVCANHDQLISSLERGFDEKIIGLGIDRDGLHIELFVSEEKGTWTILLTRPDGLSCILRNGSDWQDRINREQVKRNPV